jgi:transcription-repair coupling factor (superfamily II helicase)
MPNHVLQALNQFPRILASAEAFDEKVGVLNLAAEQPPKLAVDPKKNSPLKQLNIISTKLNILFYW